MRYSPEVHNLLVLGAEIKYEDNNNLVLSFENGLGFFLWVNDIEVAQKYMPRIQKNAFGWITGDMRTYIFDSLGLRNVSTVKRAIYRQAGKQHPAIKPLSDTDIETALIYYDKYGDREEFIQLRDRDMLWGYYEENMLQGFIGIHAEGALGILHVIKEYRKKGIATHLLNHAISKAKEQDLIPYAQIELENHGSFALHEKMDCEIGEEISSWFVTFTQD